MSEEDDRDSTPGMRPRRSTVSAKRRSLRVPVDEVPRRSSPSLTRPSFDKLPEKGTEPSLSRVSAEPLAALRTDPGVNVELADEDIEVEESREIETAAPIRMASAPPVPLAALGGGLAAAAVSASSGSSGSGGRGLAGMAARIGDDVRDSDPDMELLSGELDAVPFDPLGDQSTFGDLDGEATTGVGSATVPEGALAPGDDISSERTQVSAPPMRKSFDAIGAAPPATPASSEREPEKGWRSSVRPAAIRPDTEAAASEAKPPEAKPPEAKPPEAKPPEAKLTEAKLTEAKPPEAKPPEAAVPERRLSSPPDPIRASQPVLISQVVVVSRAITVIGSPSTSPAPVAPQVAAAQPVASPPPAAPAAALSSVELSSVDAGPTLRDEKPEPPAEPKPLAPLIEPESDSFELEVEVGSSREPDEAGQDEEPLRMSQVPELSEAEELAADELLEDAPPVKKPRSSPPPRPEPRAERSAARAGLLTPLPPAMPPSVSGPPPGGPALPHLPPPPRIPAGASVSGVASPPAAPGAPPVTAPAVPAAPAAAAPSAVPTQLDPPTDPRRSKKKGAWWEDLFNDDYLRTVPAPHPKQVSRQCDFIEARLGLVRGATVLDVGCGLGLHAIELTRRGYLVVGLDLSLPMLSRAADEAQDQGFKINFLHADMREMNFDGAFDAVLSWGTSFGYFDDDVNRGVLDRIHRALKPGGLFLLDLVNRDYVVRTQPNNVWFEGDGCVVMEETQCNYISSRLHVKRTVMLDDGRQRESAYAIRLYSLHELGQMLHKSFRVVEVSGREATPGVFFGADSPRLLVVAERRLAAPPGPPAPPKKSGEGDASSVSASLPAVPATPPADEN